LKIFTCAILLLAFVLLSSTSITVLVAEATKPMWAVPGVYLKYAFNQQTKHGPAGTPVAIVTLIQVDEEGGLWSYENFFDSLDKYIEYKIKWSVSFLHYLSPELAKEKGFSPTKLESPILGRSLVFNVRLKPAHMEFEEVDIFYDAATGLLLSAGGDPWGGTLYGWQLIDTNVKWPTVPEPRVSDQDQAKQETPSGQPPPLLVPSAAPSLGQVGAGLAFGAIGSLGYAMYSTARAAKSFGPRRPRPRRPPRGPIVSTYPWRPGRPFYSPPRPKGPQYAPAPPPPPTPSVPPSPIEPGGQPTGGAGIQGPTPYIPHAPVQNVRVAWPPGWVSLEWDPPKYNPEEYELLGYDIYRLRFTGRSTVAEPEFLPPRLPPGQNNWTRPHNQTYQYHEAGDIEGYIVYPIYRVLRRGDPYQGNVVPGDGTRVSARYIH